jgi:hypothetical protein
MHHFIFNNGNIVELYDLHFSPPVNDCDRGRLKLTHEGQPLLEGEYAHQKVRTGTIRQLRAYVRKRWGADQVHVLVDLAVNLQRFTKKMALYQK